MELEICKILYHLQERKFKGFLSIITEIYCFSRHWKSSGEFQVLSSTSRTCTNPVKVITMLLILNMMHNLFNTIFFHLENTLRYRVAILFQYLRFPWPTMTLCVPPPPRFKFVKYKAKFEWVLQAFSWIFDMMSTDTYYYDSKFFSWNLWHFYHVFSSQHFPWFQGK